MQKILEVLIKTKDEKGHVRHLTANEVEIDSIIIKANVLEAAAIEKQSKKSIAAKKKPEPKPSPKKTKK